MKLPLFHSTSRLSVRALCAGMTLNEIMIVTAIFTLLIAATVSSQVFGLKMFTISETKLIITADAREALNQMRNEIRASRKVSIGNGDKPSFKMVPDETAQRGTAIRIFPTTDTNNFVQYYIDTGKKSLKRAVSGSDGVQVVANNITTAFPFEAQDFQGIVRSNSQNHRVVRLNLEFNKREFGSTNNAMYEYFQLQTVIARRSRD